MAVDTTGTDAGPMPCRHAERGTRGCDSEQLIMVSPQAVRKNFKIVRHGCQPTS